jgi:hypothetical protein
MLQALLTACAAAAAAQDVGTGAAVAIDSNGYGDVVTWNPHTTMAVRRAHVMLYAVVECEVCVACVLPKLPQVQHCVGEGGGQGSNMMCSCMPDVLKCISLLAAELL